MCKVTSRMRRLSLIEWKITSQGSMFLKYHPKTQQPVFSSPWITEPLFAHVHMLSVFSDIIYICFML